MPTPRAVAERIKTTAPGVVGFVYTRWRELAQTARRRFFPAFLRVFSVGVDVAAALASRRRRAISSAVLTSLAEGSLCFFASVFFRSPHATITGRYGVDGWNVPQPAMHATT